MGETDFSISSTRVVLPDLVRPAMLFVRDGRVVSVKPRASRPDARRHFDLGDSVLMPGLVDSHVHVNEPGRTDWEGFATVTRAAAAGGITTIVDMPLNSTPATTTVDALNRKVDAMAGQCTVDVALWGGVVPGNEGDLPALLQEGVAGFKCFLTPSGVEDFQNVDESSLRAAASILAPTGVALLVHAELPRVIDSAPGIPPGQERSYGAYVASRPPEAECAAIDLVVEICKDTGLRAHIVHLAAGEALPELARVRAQGVDITVETCPHYLTFEQERIADGATQYKCAPPIRDHVNRVQLWQGLREGIIDLIATDHSPCPPAMKHLDTGDFACAWGGIASLQVSLPAVWTEAEARGFTLSDIARWMCEQPARLANIADRKGRIAPGYDADFVVWRPESTFTVRAGDLQHRHPVTPYNGLTLRGVVERTFVRGVEVYSEGRFREDCVGTWIKPSKRMHHK